MNQHRTRDLLFSAICLLLASGAWAQFTQTSYSPLGTFDPADALSPSARAVAMGSADVSAADDSSSLFVNPAGLAFLQRGEIGLSSDLRWAGAFQETGVVGLAFPHLGGFALAASYLTYGSLEGRDAQGSLSANYSADRLAVEGGWGREWVPGFSAGAALRYSQQTIQGNTYSSFSPEVGAQVTLVRNWKFGLDYLYGGWGPSQASMVSTLRGGLSWTWQADPQFQFLLAFSDTYQSDSLDRLQGGLQIGFLSQFFIRAGYQGYLQGIGTGGLSMGAGLELAGLTLDYAYLPDGNLGDTHRFSLGFPFGDPVQNTSMSGTNGQANPSSNDKGSSSNTLSSGISRSTTDTDKLGSSNGKEAGVSNAGTPPKPDVPVSSQPQDKKDSLTVRFNIPPDFVAQGEALESQGNHSEAVSLFKQALQQNPQNILAWWDLGNIYFKLKQKADAVPCYEKVQQLKPSDRAFANWLDQYKK